MSSATRDARICAFPQRSFQKSCFGPKIVPKIFAPFPQKKFPIRPVITSCFEMFPNLSKFGSGFEHQSAYKQDIWKTFWRYPSGLYVFGKFFEQIVRARAVLKSFVFFSFQKIFFFVSSKSFPNILFIGTLMLKELPNFERLGNISKQLVITGRIGNFF